VLAPVSSAPYADEGASFAAQAARALDAQLTFLTAVPTREEAEHARNLLRERIETMPVGLREACRPKHEVRVGAAVGAITRAAARFGLVVLVAHRKPPLEDALLGMTAERCMRSTGVPILAVPEEAAVRIAAEVPIPVFAPHPA
jgi:nucleotide-binding universal stress UspA family protein